MASPRSAWRISLMVYWATGEPLTPTPSTCHRRLRDLERKGAAAVGLNFEALVFATLRWEDPDTVTAFEEAELHTRGQLGDRETAVQLQLGKNLPVQGVHGEDGPARHKRPRPFTAAPGPPHRRHKVPVQLPPGHPRRRSPGPATKGTVWRRAHSKAAGERIRPPSVRSPRPGDQCGHSTNMDNGRGDSIRRVALSVITDTACVRSGFGARPGSAGRPRGPRTASSTG